MDRKPCFGDRVINTFAGAANPHREGVFVRSIHRLGKLNPGEWYQCTNGKGDFWEIDLRSLEIVSRASADEDRIRRETIEECAKLCEVQVQRPAGYHGAWEGYGASMGDKTGTECAIAIRALAEPLSESHPVVPDAKEGE